MRLHIYNGTVTSSIGNINMRSNLYMNNIVMFQAIITNNGRQKTSVSISNTQWGRTAINFAGANSNTYTGDTTITGLNAQLNVEKLNGAIAIQGNVNVREGAILKYHRGDQVNDRSRITLSSKGSAFSRINFTSRFYGVRNMQETIHELVVEGRGMIDFGEQDLAGGHGQRHFYLDELTIEEGSLLKIIYWADKRDHLLVRKESEHLLESLKRIEFEGYNRANISLKEYNKDYWEISALPEPTTYGAILGAVGLGCWSWRRRRATRERARSSRRPRS